MAGYTYPIGDSGTYVLRTDEPLKPWEEAWLETYLATDAAVVAAEQLGDKFREAAERLDEAFSERVRQAQGE